MRIWMVSYGVVLIEVIDVTHKIAVGATLGQSIIAPVIDRLRQRQRDATTVVVDFKNVEAVNTSFIKAVFLEFVWWGRRFAGSEDAPRIDRDSANVFPVLRRLHDDVREEIITALVSEDLAAFEVVTAHAEEIARGRVLGRLDDALRVTLEALAKEGASTAPTLCERYPSRKPIQPTAWNNRLVELHRHRLVTRERAGRQWIYGSLVKELDRG